MNIAAEILAELRERGIRIEPRPEGRLRLTPAKAADPDLLEKVRAHKAELLRLLGNPGPQNEAPADADEALRLLDRLKCYVLPGGRMPAARQIIEGLRSILAAPDVDPAADLTALKSIEAELIAIGGKPDPALTEAVAMMDRTFPGARLVEVRRKEWPQ